MMFSFMWRVYCKTCEVHSNMFLIHFPKICGKWQVIFESDFFFFIELFIQKKNKKKWLKADEEHVRVECILQMNSS